MDANPAESISLGQKLALRSWRWNLAAILLIVGLAVVAFMVLARPWQEVDAILNSVELTQSHQSSLRKFQNRRIHESPSSEETRAEIDRLVQVEERLSQSLATQSLNRSYIQKLVQRLSHNSAELQQFRVQSDHPDDERRLLTSQLEERSNVVESIGSSMIAEALELQSNLRTLQLELLIGFSLCIFLLFARSAFVSHRTHQASVSAFLQMQKELSIRELELERTGRQLEISNQAAEKVRDRFEAAAWRFEGLFNGLPVACFTTDLSGTIFEWNRTAEDLLQRAAYEAAGTSIAECLDGTLLEDRIQAIFEQLKRYEDVEPFELELEHLENRFTVITSVIPLQLRDGTISGAIWTMTDITEQKAVEHRLANANNLLENLATTDGLTGLKNHRVFQEQLAFRCAEVFRRKKPLSVMLLDVDHFKLFNDTYGHPKGDVVLQTVASILSSQAREIDFVGRYGGEEFVLLLPDCKSDAAIEVAERIRVAIESFDWPDRQITVSIGVSTSSSASADAKQLVTYADLAMYTSKSRGRNQVCHADTLEDRVA